MFARSICLNITCVYSHLSFRSFSVLVSSCTKLAPIFLRSLCVAVRQELSVCVYCKEFM